MTDASWVRRVARMSILPPRGRAHEKGHGMGSPWPHTTSRGDREAEGRESTNRPRQWPSGISEPERVELFGHVGKILAIHQTLALEVEHGGQLLVARTLQFDGRVH